jgi:hypothetical protein
MRLGITEGCDSCVSIQTCTECKCGGQVTAHVSPDLWSHDAGTHAESRAETSPDEIAQRVAPAAISPPPSTDNSYKQMVHDPETILEGLGDSEGMKPAYWMSGIGVALILGAFLFKGSDPVHELKHAVRGVGTVLLAMGAASVISSTVSKAP